MRDELVLSAQDVVAFSAKEERLPWLLYFS